VVSLLTSQLKFPPNKSNSFAIYSFDFVAVPFKIKLLINYETPEVSRHSFLVPALTITATVTKLELTYSEATLKPFSSLVFLS
jgi:hypothetical protein